MMNISLKDLKEQFHDLHNKLSKKIFEVNSILNDAKKIRDDVLYLQNNQTHLFLKELHLENFKSIDSTQVEYLQQQFEEQREKQKKYSEKLSNVKVKISSLYNQIMELNPQYLEQKNIVNNKFHFMNSSIRRLMDSLMSADDYQDTFLIAYNSSFFKRLFNKTLKDSYNLLQFIQEHTQQNPIEYIQSSLKDIELLEKIKKEFESLSKNMADLEYSKSELENAAQRINIPSTFAMYLKQNFSLDNLSESEKEKLFSQADRNYYSKNFFNSKLKAIDLFISNVQKNRKAIQKQIDFIESNLYKLNKVHYSKLNKTISVDSKSIQRLNDNNALFSEFNNSYRTTLDKLRSADFREIEYQNRNNNDLFNLMMIYLMFSPDVSAEDIHNHDFNESNYMDSYEKQFNFDDLQSSFNHVSKDITESFSTIDTYTTETRYSNNNLYDNNSGNNTGDSGGGCSGGCVGGGGD